jgi:STE24 endopeptidase
MQLYSNFVVEERHGFNKLTLTTFITDIFKTLFLTAVVAMPVLAGFLKVINWAGENFTFYVFIFMVVFQLFFIIIFPIFIQPFFNKFTPLEQGSLKSKIDGLASKLSFPLTKIFVVDGSKRSNHSNAYFFGFFRNKRIVLFDTLIEKNTEDEIEAVLAHELGHWFYSHTFQNLIIAQMHFFAMFYVFSVVINVSSMYTQFGFDTKPVIVGFLLFQVFYS